MKNPNGKVVCLDDRRPKGGKVQLGVMFVFDWGEWLTSLIELDGANCSEPDFLIAALNELTPEGRAILKKMQVCNLTYTTAVPWLEQSNGRYEFNHHLKQRAIYEFQSALRAAREAEAKNS